MLLLAVLAGLLALWRMDPFQGNGGVAVGGSCPVDEAPALAEVDPARLAGFKADLEGMIALCEALVPEEKGLTPYEQGVVSSGAAWTDMEPGNAGVPASGPQPGGFEMRWWTVGRDDLVADVFLFEDASQAEEYLDLAAGTACRSKSSRRRARFPPGGRNLEWSNPYAYAQQDVFFQRGPRVYRVSVVQPGVGSTVSATDRLAGFYLVGALACGLPGARCAQEEPPPALA